VGLPALVLEAAKRQQVQSQARAIPQAMPEQRALLRTSHQDRERDIEAGAPRLWSPAGGSLEACGYGPQPAHVCGHCSYRRFVLESCECPQCGAGSRSWGQATWYCPSCHVLQAPTTEPSAKVPSPGSSGSASSGSEPPQYDVQSSQMSAPAEAEPDERQDQGCPPLVRLPCGWGLGAPQAPSLGETCRR